MERGDPSASEYRYCPECEKAYEIHVQHGCATETCVPQESSLLIERNRGFQFIGLLVVLSVFAAASSTAAFVNRNFPGVLIAADAFAAFPWVLCPCLPIIWTHPSVLPPLTWIAIIACVYSALVVTLYVWAYSGGNVVILVWTVLVGVVARMKVPLRQDESRCALEVTMFTMAVNIFSNFFVRETGWKEFTWGKLLAIIFGGTQIIYDLKRYPHQRNSVGYASMVSIALLAVPIFYLLILQANFNIFLSMGAMIFLGGFFNWGFRTIVGWAADPLSGVFLMFPAYLAEDLFQTMLFADSGSLSSIRFWGLVCAQEGANLLKHLGVVPILRYYLERTVNPNAVHPYNRPDWVVRLQLLALQDSVSACLSVLVALTAALVDATFRASTAEGALGFSRQTRVDLLAGLYCTLLAIRIAVAFLEHVVARHLFAGLRTFRYRTKLSELLASRRHSAACCFLLSCAMIVDALKWRSYHLSGWPSVSGFTTNV